jgi:hypothetical protein
MEFKSKLDKHINSQTREVVANVFEYMEEEKTTGVLNI